jgi:hypothetical protein
MCAGKQLVLICTSFGNVELSKRIEGAAREGLLHDISLNQEFFPTSFTLRLLFNTVYDMTSAFTVYFQFFLLSQI